MFPPALKGTTSLERGPTTTEHDGTGGPSFSSKWGAQAPRQALAQTLSWICNKFIPEPMEGMKEELEVSCKNAQIWERGSRSGSKLVSTECIPCAWVTLDPASPQPAGPLKTQAPLPHPHHFFQILLNSSHTTASLESCCSQTWLRPGRGRGIC